MKKGDKKHLGCLDPNFDRITPKYLLVMIVGNMGEWEWSSSWALE